MEADVVRRRRCQLKSHPLTLTLTVYLIKITNNTSVPPRKHYRLLDYPFVKRTALTTKRSYYPDKTCVILKTESIGKTARSPLDANPDYTCIGETPRPYTQLYRYGCGAPKHQSRCRRVPPVRLVDPEYMTSEQTTVHLAPSDKRF